MQSDPRLNSISTWHYKVLAARCGSILRSLRHEPYLRPTCVTIVFIAIFALFFVSPPPAAAKPNIIGHGADGKVVVLANNGAAAAGPETASGHVDANTHVTKSVTKSPASAKGTVDDWHHIKGDINAQRAPSANGVASGSSDNTVTSTAELKGNEDRHSKSVLHTKIKAHLHDANSVKVEVTLTVKDANGNIIDTTKETYEISEDTSNVNKVVIEDSAHKKQTVPQGAEHPFDASGQNYTLRHGTPSPAKFTLEFKVSISGKTESVAEVEADSKFHIE